LMQSRECCDENKPCNSRCGWNAPWIKELIFVATLARLHQRHGALMKIQNAR